MSWLLDWVGCVGPATILLGFKPILVTFTGFSISYPILAKKETGV